MVKINHPTHRLAVRSLAANPQLLREAGDWLCAKRKAPRWSLYCLDGREISPNEPDALIKFYPARLSSMRHFKICHKNEAIWEVAVGAEGEYDSKLLDIVIERFRQLELRRTRSANMIFTIENGDVPAFSSFNKIWISFGWRTHTGPPGYFVRADSVVYGGCAPTAARYGLVTRCIEHLGLKDNIRVVGNEQDFVLRAADGWSLYELEKNWPPYDHNPTFFPIGPFPSFDDVWQRAERFLASPLGKKIDRLSVSFCMTPDVYETMYEQLNELANEWDILTYGSYADGIDPYTADASQSPDGRFPVFVWSPEQGIDNVFYQADIVPTPEGRFLEIHSNCGDMKKLLKEAEAATGLRFAPVESGAGDVEEL